MPSSRSPSAVWNPAGGWRYHWRALRHSRRLWEPFRWPLGEWLLRWETTEPTLLLVGPSAGYNLQPFLLERFQRVVVLEPDPVAHWLLARRLAKVPLDPRPALEFIAEDQLVFHPERFAPLLERVGPSAVLFCNVLGQLQHLLGVEDTEQPAFVAVRAAVQAALVGRSWASFHDRVSGSLAPSLEDPVVSPQRWSDAELLEQAYYGGTDPQAAALQDHGTEGFFPAELPHVYLRWELEPGAFHLIEGVFSIPDDV
ncbi:MAG TPA: hypothetical protein VJU61_07930 [Polyangiaceae bacterium]|nr:hypothetical protein [Polyangiaceae bacterium]